MTALAAAPTLLGSLRAAASDVFYHAIRVVPANVLWGALFLVSLWAWAALGSIPAALVAALLGIPTAGIARLGGHATRGRDVNLSDVLEPIRQRPLAVLAAGLGSAIAVLVLAANLVAGLWSGGPVGWAFATLAAWGIVAFAAFSLAFWPLLADPERDAVPARAIARLAALLVLAPPVRLGALVLVVAVLVVLSTIAMAALLTITVGFVLLTAARFVLPAADRLEVRLAGRAPTAR